MPDQMVIEAEPQARTLAIPEWTYDDFTEEGPYKWLFQFKDNQFVLNQMLAKAGKRAREVKFQIFMKMWNAYVAAQKNQSPTIVGENTTAFPGQETALIGKEKALNCKQYCCDENGIYYTNAMGQTVEVLSHPLMPVRLFRNLDTDAQKTEIKFFRGSKPNWISVIENSGVMASAQRIVNLADKGIAVNSENAKELVNFITKVVSANYDTLPKQDSTSHLGWLKDGRFSPYCENVEFDGDNPEFKNMYASFKETGSEDVWMQIAKTARAGKSIPARIALAASFAAPLVKILGGLPFFVHLWGTSGCGKTVGLMLAASVWANPTVGQYIKTFAGTKVSQEIYASFCGNVPILLDELQIISDRRSFDDIIYMLCEGANKGRGTKDGGLQRQRLWASTIITSAEMPIVQANSGGGAASRCIEVNYGGEPLFPDSRMVAETLKQNYGFAGRKFIEALKEQDTMKALREIQHRLYNQLDGDIHEKQVLSASILLAADKLADIVIFKDGRHLTVDEVKPYLITKQQADVNARAYNWLIGFIGGNPRRFQDDDAQNGELWGIIKEDVCYFNRVFFDKVMQAEGFSAGSFLTWAERNDKILRQDYGRGSGNQRLTVRRTIGGQRVACVALVLPSEDEETTAKPEGFSQVDDPDLPF